MAYLSCKNIFVTLPTDVELNISSITRRHIGLRHQKSRAYLALQQRGQPFLLLSLIAILGQNFHIASIRCSIIGSLFKPISHIQTGPILERWSTSEATLDLPNISAISPYSKLVKPAPSEKWFLGKNMFHNPSFLAFVLSSSMMGGCALHRWAWPSPICFRYVASAGIHSFSTNSSTFSRSVRFR